jgi:hypothetical protein
MAAEHCLARTRQGEQKEKGIVVTASDTDRSDPPPEPPEPTVAAPVMLRDLPRTVLVVLLLLVLMLMLPILIW